MENATGTVLDTAAYILSRYKARENGNMTAFKLQKLVYYSQAWNLAWTGEPLFHDPIEAWVHGPAIHSLFKLLKGQYHVHRLPPGTGATIRNLNETQRRNIDKVLKKYGPLSPAYLITLVHEERPWQQARERDDNVGSNQHSRETITYDDLQSYYTSSVWNRQVA